MPLFSPPRNEPKPSSKDELSLGEFLSFLSVIAAIAGLISVVMRAWITNRPPQAAPPEWDRPSAPPDWRPAPADRGPDLKALAAELMEKEGIELVDALPAPSGYLAPRETLDEIDLETQPEPSPALTVVSVTEQVSRGNEATLAALAPPGANCFLRFTNPSGSESNAQGLGEKTADTVGRVSWTWTISRGATPGDGVARITAAVDGREELSAAATIHVA